MQLRLRISHAAPQHFCNFVVLISFDVVEDENQTVSWREILDCSLQRYTIGQRMEAEIRRDQLLLFPFFVFVKLVSELGEQRYGIVAAVLAQVHQYAIHRNLIKPRGEGGISSKAPQFPKGCQEGLLHQVFRQCVTVKHSPAQCEDRFLVLLIK